MEAYPALQHSHRSFTPGRPRREIAEQGARFAPVDRAPAQLLQNLVKIGGFRCGRTGVFVVDWVRVLLLPAAVPTGPSYGLLLPNCSRLSSAPSRSRIRQFLRTHSRRPVPRYSPLDVEGRHGWSCRPEPSHAAEFSGSGRLSRAPQQPREKRDSTLDGRRSQPHRYMGQQTGPAVDQPRSVRCYPNQTSRRRHLRTPPQTGRNARSLHNCSLR